MAGGGGGGIKIKNREGGRLFGTREYVCTKVITNIRVSLLKLRLFLKLEFGLNLVFMYIFIGCRF